GVGDLPQRDEQPPGRLQLPAGRWLGEVHQEFDRHADLLVPGDEVTERGHLRRRLLIAPSGHVPADDSHRPPAPLPRRPRPCARRFARWPGSPSPQRLWPRPPSRGTLRTITSAPPAT